MNRYECGNFFYTRVRAEPLREKWSQKGEIGTKNGEGVTYLEPFIALSLCSGFSVRVIPYQLGQKNAVFDEIQKKSSIVQYDASNSRW